MFLFWCVNVNIDLVEFQLCFITYYLEHLNKTRIIMINIIILVTVNLTFFHHQPMWLVGFWSYQPFRRSTSCCFTDYEWMHLIILFKRLFGFSSLVCPDHCRIWSFSFLPFLLHLLHLAFLLITVLLVYPGKHSKLSPQPLSVWYISVVFMGNAVYT